MLKIDNKSNKNNKLEYFKKYGTIIKNYFIFSDYESEFTNKWCDRK